MTDTAHNPETFNLLSFTGKMKILHMTWIAFFITFLVWFNLAPMLQAIADTFGLSNAQIKSLLVLNVSLAIPARIIVGMLTDRYGPRKVYSEGKCPPEMYSATYMSPFLSAI